MKLLTGSNPKLLPPFYINPLSAGVGLALAAKQANYLPPEIKDPLLFHLDKAFNAFHPFNTAEIVEEVHAARNLCNESGLPLARSIAEVLLKIA